MKAQDRKLVEDIRAALRAKTPYEGCGVLENRKFRPFSEEEEQQLGIGYVPGIVDETPQELYGKPDSGLRVVFTNQ